MFRRDMACVTYVIVNNVRIRGNKDDDDDDDDDGDDDNNNIFNCKWAVARWQWL